MYTVRFLLNKLFVRNSLGVLLPLLLLMTAFPSFGAELSIQYEQIARSGTTPIPDGVGTFSGFSDNPAIDSGGNVVFTATGVDQSGVYTFVDVCCQKVADKNTLIPGGGGATFTTFYGSDKNDIDGGRIAFRANTISPGKMLGLYSNVGQATANDLVEIAFIDGSEWSSSSEPWVDGDVVSMRGERVIPTVYNTILRWDGPSLSMTFVDAGAGYNIGSTTQSAISGDATIFRRIKPGASELVISSGGFHETLVLLGTTPIPGQPGLNFSNVNNFPVIDRGGLDAAFRGNGSGLQGVYKRIDGGALEEVADNATIIPGTSDLFFVSFPEDEISLANGQVVFSALGPSLLSGVYTDIGGELSVIVDDQDNDTILLNGEPEQISAFGLSHKSFAYTPEGYMVVFEATLQSGGTALIRATITVDNSAPGTSPASPPTADFEDGNAYGWLLNGNVAIDGILAIGQYSLRHGKSATSVLSVSTAGYDGVSVTMHLAATSLKKHDTCYAEVSTNGGNSWVPVIEVHDGNDDGTFYSGTVSPPGADDNLNLQLRFRASGRGNRGYCYGDDVTVLGTLIGGPQSAP